MQSVDTGASRRRWNSASSIHAFAPAPNRHIILDGVSIGLPKNDLNEIDTSLDFSYCKICGWVYQGKLTRSPQANPSNPLYNPAVYTQAVVDRATNANNHYSLGHSEAERAAYESSGLFLCPEAAIKLAPLGVIDLTGIVRTPEVRQAYAEAKSTPNDKDLVM